MIDRNKFAEYAENNWKTVEYKKVDCQQFVENAAKYAGYTFNARGTNDMWRNYMAAKGNTSSFPLAIGDVVFKWREESNKLPEKYRGDKQGDIYHIGIVTGLNPYTVCHSANSKENGKRDSFDSIAALSKVWSKCGTLKHTESETAKPDMAEAIELINKALEILENVQ